jgi:hypothetical protein
MDRNNCSLKLPICPLSAQILGDLTTYYSDAGKLLRAKQCEKGYERHRNTTGFTNAILIMENPKKFIGKFLRFLEQKKFDYVNIVDVQAVEVI